VTTAETDMVDSLRAELAAIDPPRRCCRVAEAAGLAGAFEPRRRNVARLALRLSRGRLSGEQVTITGPESAAAGPTPGFAAGPASVPAAGSALAPAAESGLVLAARPAPTWPAFEWSHSAEHCRVAWLRGRFLAHGSLSLASGRTHLEFVLPLDAAIELCERLGQFQMAAAWRIRRGRGVVTWKSVETVGTFLRLVGGVAALLELEARQVSRTVRGDLNRVINAESANLGRAVAAAARNLEAISTLEADGRLAEQPYVVKLVADARREEPESTLAELAERLGLHRSAVQRALERIERLALHPDDGVGKRRRTRAD
jgi:hypothetical protein